MAYVSVRGEMEGEMQVKGDGGTAWSTVLFLREKMIPKPLPNLVEVDTDLNL